MTSVPRWEPDGTESPAERTDPLLPAITDDMLPPLDLPRLPTLDDRTLERMLAELEGGGLEGGGLEGGGLEGGGFESGALESDKPAAADAPDGPTIDPTSDPVLGRPKVTAEPAPQPPSRIPPPALTRDSQPDTASRPAEDPRTPEPPLRLVEHPGSPAGYRPARGPARKQQATYVRRDPRPPEVHADALSLTGLTRRSQGRVGSLLFKIVFVGIFLLILVQAIVSLLTPGG